MKPKKPSPAGRTQTCQHSNPCWCQKLVLLEQSWLNSKLAQRRKTSLLFSHRRSRDIRGALNSSASPLSLSRLAFRSGVPPPGGRGVGTFNESSDSAPPNLGPADAPPAPGPADAPPRRGRPRPVSWAIPRVGVLTVKCHMNRARVSVSLESCWDGLAPPLTLVGMIR